MPNGEKSQLCVLFLVKETRDHAWSIVMQKCRVLFGKNINYYIIFSSFSVLLSIVLFRGEPILSGNPNGVLGSLWLYLLLFFILSWNIFINDTEQKKLFEVIVFSGWIVTCFVLLFPVFFQVNDDLEIMKFVQNGFDAVFMSVFLGRLLSFLYLNISINIPWYGIFLYFFNFVSLILFILGFKQLDIPRKKKLCFFIAIIVFYLYQLSWITFTSTAMIVGIASVFSYMVIIKTNGSNKLRYIFLLGFVFSFSYLIRTSSLQGVLLISLPLFIYFIKDYKKHILFLLPVFLVISVDGYLKNYTTSEQYQQFVKFNAIRGRLHGFPLRRMNERKLSEMNSWSENDFLLFMYYWTFPSEEKYNVRTLETIKKLEQPFKLVFIQELKRITNSYNQFFVQHLDEFVLFYGLFLVILFYRKNGRRETQFIILFFVYANLLIAGMTTYLRYPPWVSRPMFIFMILCLLLFIKVKNEQVSKKKLYTDKILWGVFFLCGIYFVQSGISSLSSTISYQVKIPANNKKIMEELSSFGKNAVFYILPRAHIMLEGPFQRRKFNDFSNLASGWSTFSPYFYAKIRAHGISRGHEIFPWTLRHPDVYFITDPLDFTRDYPARLVMFFNETYSIQCRVENIREINRFLVFRILKTD